MLHWAGGKARLPDELFLNFPANLNNYYGSFTGGGSVLIELLERVDEASIRVTGKIHVNDINETLVKLYKAIKWKSKELIQLRPNSRVGTKPLQSRLPIGCRNH